MHGNESGGLGKVALGAVIFLTGLGLTVLGSSAKAGGGYILFWGAMLTGAGLVVNGLMSLSEDEFRSMGRWMLLAFGAGAIVLVALAIPRFQAASEAVRERDIRIAEKNAEKKSVLARGVRDGFGDGVALVGTKYDSAETATLSACADRCIAETNCAGYSFDWTSKSCTFFSHVRSQRSQGNSFSDIVSR